MFMLLEKSCMQTNMKYHCKNTTGLQLLDIKFVSYRISDKGKLPGFEQVM